MRSLKRYSLVFWLYCILFILAPLTLLILFSFTTISRGNTSDISFTLDHIKTALTPMYLDVVWMSLKVALYTTLICLVVGYTTAYFLIKVQKKYQLILLVLFVLPMWMNMLLRTYAWRTILISNGLLNQFLAILGINKLELLNTNAAVLVGMVYNFLPFMIFPIFISLSKIDESLIESSNDLGASKIKTFWKVIFPLSIPGVVSGIILVFMPSATSFVIPTYLGGGKVDLIGNIIERQFTVIGNWNLGSALSLIILSILIVTTLLLYRGEKKYVQDI